MGGDDTVPADGCQRDAFVQTILGKLNQATNAPVTAQSTLQLYRIRSATESDLLQNQTCYRIRSATGSDGRQNGTQVVRERTVWPFSSPASLWAPDRSSSSKHGSAQRTAAQCSAVAPDRSTAFTSAPFCTPDPQHQPHTRCKISRMRSLGRSAACGSLGSLGIGPTKRARRCQQRWVLGAETD